MTKKILQEIEVTSTTNNKSGVFLKNLKNVSSLATDSNWQIIAWQWANTEENKSENFIENPQSVNIGITYLTKDNHRCYKGGFFYSSLEAESPKNFQLQHYISASYDNIISNFTYNNSESVKNPYTGRNSTNTNHTNKYVTISQSYQEVIHKTLTDEIPDSVTAQGLNKETTIRHIIVLDNSGIFDGYTTVKFYNPSNKIIVNNPGGLGAWNLITPVWSQEYNAYIVDFYADISNYRTSSSVYLPHINQVNFTKMYEIWYNNEKMVFIEDVFKAPTSGRNNDRIHPSLKAGMEYRIFKTEESNKVFNATGSGVSSSYVYGQMFVCDVQCFYKIPDNYKSSRVIKIVPSNYEFPLGYNSNTTIDVSRWTTVKENIYAGSRYVLLYPRSNYNPFEVLELHSPKQQFFPSYHFFGSETDRSMVNKAMLLQNPDAILVDADLKGKQRGKFYTMELCNYKHPNVHIPSALSTVSREKTSSAQYTDVHTIITSEWFNYSDENRIVSLVKKKTIEYPIIQRSGSGWI